MADKDEGIVDGLESPADVMEETPESETNEDAEGAEYEEISPASEEIEGEELQDKGKKSGIKSRIDELVKDREEIRRDRDYYRDLALKGVDKKEAAPEKKEPEAPKKPTQDEYDTYEDYIEALSDWKSDQKLAQTEKRLEEKLTQRSARETRERAIKEKFEEARKRLPDFDEVLRKTEVTEDVHGLVTGSEMPAEVAYYLGKNPEVTRRINALAPIDAAREIGKIEAKIQTRLRDASPPPKKKTPTAPALQKPLGGGASSSGKNPSEMTHEEYRQMRREEMKKARR